MMNYLKKFESFQTHDEIHKICEQYDITNYTINEDDSIDVNGDVDLALKSLTRLPIRFNKVSGYFDCSKNSLTTLEGAPKSVFDFICYHNELTTLEYAPQFVDRWFNCSVNKLTTLEGSPQFVGGDFNCSHNALTTLEGSPQSVDRFYCGGNKDLKSLKYLPEYVTSEKVDFRYTPVYEIFKLLDNFSLGMIRNVNDLDVIVDDKINLEMLNALLYDEGKPPVEKVKGYINI